MERRKSSGNKKDITLKLSCAGSRRDQDLTGTSFYEIDIQSYVYNKRKKSKKYLKKKAIEEKTIEQFDYDDPILLSHYPTLTTGEEAEKEKEDADEPEELEKEGKEPGALEVEIKEPEELEESEEETKESIKPKTKNCKKVNKSVELEAKIETSAQTADKENQAQSFDNVAFRNQLKSYIIENFLSSRSRELREIAQNSGYNVDSNEVHLHHHEHHHHYYLDNVGAMETYSWPQTTKEYVSVPTQSWPKPPGEETETAYYCKCQVPQSDGRARKSRQFNSKSSSDENADKSSDFIRSHEYSDTDLKNQDSTDEDEHKEKSRTSMENLQQSYNVLMNSLKSFNDFTSPMIITNHKTKPKISYIHCECTSNISLDLTAEFTAETTDPETEEARSEVTVSSGIYPSRNSNQGNITDRFGLKSITSHEDSDSEMEYRKKRLKNELRKVEQDLQWMEDMGLRKTSLFVRHGLCSNETINQRWVSVYSSKSFIFHVNKIFNYLKGERLTEDHKISLF